MLIPNGSWVVVQRHARDTRTKGRIIRGGLSRRAAQYLAASHNHPDYNFWAMSKQKYNCPYTGDDDL